MRGRLLQPGAERPAAHACLRDIDHAPHRATGEVHRPNVRPRERLVGGIRAEAEHQLVAHDPAAHVTSQHERETAEHLPLAQIGVWAKHVADATREFLVVSHLRVLVNHDESMELNGALSNPLESSKNPLERLRCMVRELLGRTPIATSAPVRPRRRPSIRAAVEEVTLHARAPIRAADVHAALAAQGHDANKDSIRKALHDRTRGPAARLRRVGHGLYARA